MLAVAIVALLAVALAGWPSRRSRRRRHRFPARAGLPRRDAGGRGQLHRLPHKAGRPGRCRRQAAHHRRRPLLIDQPDARCRDRHRRLVRSGLPARLARRRVARRPHLFPVFPYSHYTRLEDADIGALYAYFMTRPPVTAPNRPNSILSSRSMCGRCRRCGRAFLQPRPLPAGPRPRCALEPRRLSRRGAGGLRHLPHRPKRRRRRTGRPSLCRRGDRRVVRRRPSISAPRRRDGTRRSSSPTCAKARAPRTASPSGRCAASYAAWRRCRMMICAPSRATSSASTAPPAWPSSRRSPGARTRAAGDRPTAAGREALPATLRGLPRDGRQSGHGALAARTERGAVESLPAVQSVAHHP